MADGSNVPPPYIIFKASGFRAMNDWDQKEVKEYHLGVIVLFQEKTYGQMSVHICMD